MSNNTDIKPRKRASVEQRLPCQTLIATGFCPYRNRCKFIHDHRLRGCTDSKLRRKKTESDVGGGEGRGNSDMFFWPMQNKIGEGQYPGRDEYHVQRKGGNRIQDVRVDSMWQHLVSFTSGLSPDLDNELQCPASIPSIDDISVAKGTKRLKTLAALSEETVNESGYEAGFESPGDDERMDCDVSDVETRFGRSARHHAPPGLCASPVRSKQQGERKRSLMTRSPQSVASMGQLNTRGGGAALLFPDLPWDISSPSSSTDSWASSISTTSTTSTTSASSVNARSMSPQSIASIATVPEQSGFCLPNTPSSRDARMNPTTHVDAHFY